MVLGKCEKAAPFQTRLFVAMKFHYCKLNHCTYRTIVNSHVALKQQLRLPETTARQRSQAKVNWPFFNGIAIESSFTWYYCETRTKMVNFSLNMAESRFRMNGLIESLHGVPSWFQIFIVSNSTSGNWASCFVVDVGPSRRRAFHVFLIASPNFVPQIWR